MDFKTILFQEYTREEWKSAVSKVCESTFYHSWVWLNYMSAFSNVKSHNSMISYQTEQEPLVIEALAREIKCSQMAPAFTAIALFNWSDSDFNIQANDAESGKISV